MGPTAQVCNESRQVSGDWDQHPPTDTDRSLMLVPECVVKHWFNEPTEPMSRSGPIHEIQGKFCGERVFCYTEVPHVDPFGANPNHELRLFRKRPRLLKQYVRIPFDRFMGENWSSSYFHLQPVFYRCKFNGDISAAARSALDVPTISHTEFDDCDWFACDWLFLGSLRDDRA